MNVFLLAVSFAVILAGALLFTNAVEWIGHRLKLGEGAVGSLLAAVGTAMPETLIAIVALLGARRAPKTSRSGRSSAPRSCSRRWRWAWSASSPTSTASDASQGLELDAHAPTLERDLLFFLAFFALAAGARLGARRPRCGSRSGSSVLLAYPSTSAAPCAAAARCRTQATLDPLIFERRAEHRDQIPALALCVIQLLVGLGAMVGGAHLFVEELLHIAESLGVEAVVLALILAPLATELPEKVNSFFWVREGKDALALGNITGAMVFQSTIPVGIGLIFTDWELSGNAALSIALGLAGGLLAYESPAPPRPLLPAGGDRLVRALRVLHRRRRRLSA